MAPPPRFHELFEKERNVSSTNGSNGSKYKLYDQMIFSSISNQRSKFAKVRIYCPLTEVWLVNTKEAAHELLLFFALLASTVLLLISEQLDIIIEFVIESLPLLKVQDGPDLVLNGCWACRTKKVKHSMFRHPDTQNGGIEMLLNELAPNPVMLALLRCCANSTFLLAELIKFTFNARTSENDEGCENGEVFKRRRGCDCKRRLRLRRRRLRDGCEDEG
ncbi:hypothetical protein IEQ34_001566 [Dendrobium chrysotoxum]|uniref:Uncharacterized protein n=1 Tax=Dendrobium chrysotoxum TaxID=161865 RepID=A0AAV7HPL3_DENCH|nr:hypothetical protein IEQ34_001566 [Dendrobium chrysotoxum]